MKLQLNTIAKRKTYTIGELFIDGMFFCDTLEDTVREDGIKIYGETAIPAGTYKGIINHSNRFKKDMPLLLNVPNFEGIRIHAGNTSEDTHGCILVGINDVTGRISQSTKTFMRLMDILEPEFEITIKR